MAPPSQSFCSRVSAHPSTRPPSLPSTLLSLPSLCHTTSPLTYHARQRISPHPSPTPDPNNPNHQHPSSPSQARPPLVCAHGGDTTSAPPNTVAAFRASLAAGADCVEIDAALSKDGVLVVLHVRELTQLLGKPGMQVRARASGPPVSHLQERISLGY